MKICLIIDDYLPESIKVGAKMMHQLAVEFVKRGHDVSVITASATLKNKYEVKEIDGVNIYYFKTGSIKNVGKIKRAINETLLSYNAWKAYKSYFVKNPHDIIIYYSPTIFWGSLVKKLKKLWGARSYLILRDFFPQWVIDNGILKENSPISMYFRYFEKINYQSADIIGIQSPNNVIRFNEIISGNYEQDILYNWAANEPVKTSNDYYRQKYGLQNKVIFFYGGNMGHAQDMMNIVRLANNMKNENSAHFVLVGEGDEVSLVSKAIDAHVLENITLLPSVSQDEYKAMLTEFDIGLFTLHKDHSTHNFPGKLLGYMVQELPILGSINKGNDLKEVIEESNAGLITLNGDDSGLLSNALKFLHHKEFREETGKNANKLLTKTFSVEAAANQILVKLNNIST